MRIEDGRGNVIEEFRDRSHRVLDASVARQISDILSDNVARTPLYGPNSPLHFPSHDVAAKTGTTNDNRDAWILGYTPTIAVGAWAGNNIPEPMNQISGLIVTPMWREFMDFALERRDEEFFREPEATPSDIKPILRGVWFDPSTLITDDGFTPDLSIESALAGAHSILYFVDKDNPRGPYPSNPADDSQFTLWEYPVSLWKSSLSGLNNSSPEDFDEESEEDDD
jgi:membrane peptidoglycan carboxypeptidase